MELGILEAHLLGQLLESRTLQMLRDIEALTGEAGEVIITSTGKYPFNEGVITVPLTAELIPAYIQRPRKIPLVPGQVQH